MSTTAQQIFEQAILIMDGQDEATGATETADTKEYKSRTLAILYTLQMECFPYSDTYRVTTAGTRPLCPMLTAFDMPLAVDDGLCRGVLPYGLAAHLLLGENAPLASFFNERYEQQKTALARGVPRAFTDIEDSYGGIEYASSATW